ncbi:MAG: ABC transporter ATP-binding protein [Chloroflexi bacterium]|nr:MAG: ABC transporter ATP-binding protein [Chloroflexota bacterium]MBL1195283.1 ABC transporter ATP-binding protein [Chloroflexota bacterium]NOH12567.1 ABC transporter ATP-binding protein [Chloroflexota bacterium]
MSTQEITPPEYYLRDDEQRQGYDSGVLRDLLAFMRPYQRQFIFSFILMTIGTVSVVAGPFLVKVAIDDGITQNDPVALRNAVLLYLLAILVQWLVTYIRINIMARAGQSIIYDMRDRLFNHIQKLSLGFFSRYSVGRLIARVINDVSSIRDFVTWSVIASARNLFTLVGTLIAMLALNLQLSLYTFTVLPLIMLATYIFRNRIREVYRRVRIGNSWVNSVLAENINGVRVVQAFTREDYNYERFSQEVNQYHLQNNLKSASLISTFFPTVDMIGSLAVALVVWLGGAAVLGADITPGVLVAFVLYIERFFNPIQDLSRRYDQLQVTLTGGERVLELLRTDVEVADDDTAVELPRINGDVHFEDVSFHYSDDPDTVVLQDIELKAERGQTIALVGQTGAGKSTLIKLLSRFHDPTQGRVCIDGFDLRSVTQASLRSQMGIVLQEPFLFSGTVQENIQFGRLDASLQEVEAAAKAVGAHDFISKLRNGYETTVEEGGALLSEGQRQLISFARALLADPRILILDEATSSVDTQTEQLIQKALATLLEGRTSFVIAHRLSTIINADLIVVVDGGEIIERGTHEDLLQKRGAYFQLYSMGFKDRPETD